MSKKLVAYFSASGVTAKVAERLAASIDAELFEIVPKEPYTEADLRWTNPLARCNREKIGRKDVPIAATVENMESFDTVFIGFPIWYYGAPNIIVTFLKGYDWSDRKIVLFATSGGSDIGKTAPKLQKYIGNDAEIISSKLFSPSVSLEELKAWAEKL